MRACLGWSTCPDRSPDPSTSVALSDARIPRGLSQGHRGHPKELISRVTLDIQAAGKRSDEGKGLPVGHTGGGWSPRSVADGSALPRRPPSGQALAATIRIALKWTTHPERMANPQVGQSDSG